MPYKDEILGLTAITGQQVTADANSTDYFDFEVTNPAMDGRPLAVVVDILAKDTAGTGITFELCQKISEPTTTDATIATYTYLAAEIVAGKQLVLPLPSGKTWLRYFRLYFNITAGSEDYTMAVYFGPDPRI